MEDSDKPTPTAEYDYMCRIGVSWDKRTGCEAHIRDLPLLPIDMPVQHGGAGKNSCPHEILFTAVGSCYLGTFLVFQRQLRLELVDMNVSVEGSVELNKSGKDFGKFDVTHLDVHVKVAVKGDEDDRDIVGDCLRLTREHCPTMRALQNTVPIDVVSEITMVPE
jgi:organic hydroperoxide reductase OsmC/OhrA